MATYTDNKKKNNRKWDAENLDRMSIAFPKGTKNQIKAAAEAAGESMNQYVYAAVMSRINQEPGSSEE